jgi:hypothetical protein
VAAGWPNEDVTGCVRIIAIFALVVDPPEADPPEADPPEDALELELDDELPHAAVSTRTAALAAIVATDRKYHLFIPRSIHSAT